MFDETGKLLLVDFGKAKALHKQEDDVSSSIEGTY